LHLLLHLGARPRSASERLSDASRRASDGSPDGPRHGAGVDHSAGSEQDG
jgi:hypothetical protein